MNRSDATESRSNVSVAEDLYLEWEERLKRYFEGNEVSVGYAGVVLRSIADLMDDDGDLIDQNAGHINCHAVLDELMYKTATGVLEVALRAETAAHQNLLKLIQKRMAQRDTEPIGSEQLPPEDFYWKWLAQWEGYFADRHCEPTRANATAVFKRLATNIDAEGVLRDRKGQEVTNTDAYIARIARNVLCERLRNEDDLIGPKNELEIATLPESDVDAQRIDEDQQKECKTRCVDELWKRLKDRLLGYPPPA
jgi:hypothetical protein